MLAATGVYFSNELNKLEDYTMQLEETLEVQKESLHKTETELKDQIEKYSELHSEKTELEKKLKDKEERIDNLEEDKRQLEQDLSAKRERERQVAEAKKKEEQRKQEQVIVAKTKATEPPKVTKTSNKEAEKPKSKEAKPVHKEESKNETPKKEEPKEEPASNQGKLLGGFTASHYGALDGNQAGITALGIDVRNNIYHNGMRVIAVDPNVIPLGSIVRVNTPYGSFKAIAGDTGGAIKGNKIDILVGSQEEAFSLGVVNVTIELLS